MVDYLRSGDAQDLKYLLRAPSVNEGLRRGSLREACENAALHVKLCPVYEDRSTPYQVTFALESHQNGRLVMATSSTAQRSQACENEMV